ncbi:MAG: hypothetical protein GF388_04190 [Candidatus Aegiribacteria sp.]|nr:hypothetical protein [Candidatus Aegiribacteria sp.]MBD3294440.1 hypothetical protein [Candidatus Fermentibacteria bacterium]
MKWLLSGTLLLLLLISGCMGTYETARVVPIKVGVTYFTSIRDNDDPDDEDEISLPGIFAEAGFPAGPSRFGVGFHLKAGGNLIDAEKGVIAVWGAKLQIPENSLLDIAFGMDVWGILPGEIKLHLSRRIGTVEPYLCLAAVDFFDYDDDGDFIDLFSGEGNFSYTVGAMVELGKGSGWIAAGEIEGGEVWKIPGAGIGVFREF